MITKQEGNELDVEGDRGRSIIVSSGLDRLIDRWIDSYCIVSK